MNDAARSLGMAGLSDRPTYQWEPARSGAPLTLHLHGALGYRELRRVVDALLDGARSPRDLVCVDFEGVEHVDYRAIPEFMAALGHFRNRGATVWFVGVSDYVRALFQVSGQGPALGRLSWWLEATTHTFGDRRDGGVLRGQLDSTRDEAWSMTGI